MKKIESPEQARRVIAEAAKRAKNAVKVDFDKLSFGPQKDFIEDGNHLVAAICGRQCGKTEGMALKLLSTAFRYPGAPCLYITLSRPSAKRIMWPKLLAWDRKLQLGAKFNHAELTMTLPNGSQIMLGGANDESEIERYRGITTPLIVCDEAQAFRAFLKPMVEDILEPATIVYQGQICLIGTPNPACIGYFFDATNGLEKGWSTHHWTILNNPFVGHAEKWLEEHVLGKRGISRSDPRFRREWLGEWVRDTEGLVYDIRDMNKISELPDGDWRRVLGIDIGYVDASAFVVMAYDTDRAETIVEGSFQKTELIPSAIAAEVEKLCEQYDFERIVIDPGGGGKLMVEELRQRYGIPAEVAEKRAKMAAIELLNGDIRSNSFKVVAPDNEELLHDASLLQWDYRKLEKNKSANGGFRSKEVLQIDDRTPDHLLDAMLYAYRACKAFLYDPEENPPKVGTKEWTDAVEAELLEKAEARVRGKDGDLPWWAQ